ncbi:hypothetical protein AK812_SmicGene10914 [Symbiodinium microadriaticum]|uniref:Uncharacterized protein n=1 Tax=Symbiodinium microadriaticum TaxID=2951 RepID=A0A1Q9EEL9_SYMMI|nr:hypothetical protein AK812_SmicGene10914 [Symbiodinium microadriaticum]
METGCGRDLEDVKILHQLGQGAARPTHAGGCGEKDEKRRQKDLKDAELGKRVAELKEVLEKTVVPTSDIDKLVASSKGLKDKRSKAPKLGSKSFLENMAAGGLQLRYPTALDLPPSEALGADAPPSSTPNVSIDRSLFRRLRRRPSAPAEAPKEPIASKPPGAYRPPARPSTAEGKHRPPTRGAQVPPRFHS